MEVLRKPDGTIETACRGELRHGDHAEFTLLERKQRRVTEADLRRVEVRDRVNLTERTA